MLEVSVGNPPDILKKALQAYLFVSVTLLSEPHCDCMRFVMRLLSLYLVVQ